VRDAAAPGASTDERRGAVAARDAPAPNASAVPAEERRGGRTSGRDVQSTVTCGLAYSSRPLDAAKFGSEPERVGRQDTSE